MDLKQGLQDPEILVRRYFDNPSSDLKDMILVQYSGTVERLARRFSGVETFDDLVQVGYIGLLNALSKFDPEAGVRFSTYATHLIAGEIKHYLRDKSQIIRHPAWLQELRHKVNRAVLTLQGSLRRTPTSAEIAQECGVSEQAVEEVFATAELLKVTSFDSTTPGDDDTSELDNFAANCDDQVSVEERVVLEHAMSQLRELEREVIVRFHFDSMSQTEIAKELGISCNYVSHILRQSLSKLRRILASEEVSDRKLKKQLNLSDDNLLNPQIGVYNEAFFKQRVKEEIHRSQSDDTDLSIVLIKFNGLESWANFYGKEAVVDLLADAAEFLRQHVRRLDLVCCYGKDGFGVILPFTGVTCDVVSKRLQQKFIPWLNSRRGPAGSIGVQIGQATLTKGMSKPSDLLRVAEHFDNDSGDLREPKAA